MGRGNDARRLKGHILNHRQRSNLKSAPYVQSCLIPLPLGFQPMRGNIHFLNPSTVQSAKELNMQSITEKEIEDVKTSAGGWTRNTLASWGISWPPPKGWRKTILQFGIPQDHSKNVFYNHESPSSTERAAKYFPLVKQILLDGVQSYQNDPHRLFDAAIYALELLERID